MQTNTLTHTPSIAHLAQLVDCLDEDAFAKLAGVKKSTLEAWRKRGQGPEYALLGCNYLYPIAAVRNHVAGLVKPRSTIDSKKVLM